MCQSCGEKLKTCTGHFGSVDLCLPVFHTGYFKQTLNITKAYMADMTPPDQRTASLSWLYAAKSMGFIVGPLCGGFLYKTYPMAPFLISGTVYLLIASGVFFFAPGGRGTLVALPRLGCRRHPRLRMRWTSTNNRRRSDH